MLHRLLPGLCLLLYATVTLAEEATDTNSSAETAQPSAELLEFLADFGDVDEQTYELIEYHALQRDRNKAQEKSDDE